MTALPCTTPAQPSATSTSPASPLPPSTPLAPHCPAPPAPPSLQIAYANPPFHALIDTGALITGFSNLQVAKYLLSEDRLPGFEGVVFLDELGRKVVLMRATGRVVLLEECGMSLEKRFAFYDQVLCRSSPQFAPVRPGGAADSGTGGGGVHQTADASDRQGHVRQLQTWQTPTEAFSYCLAYPTPRGVRGRLLFSKRWVPPSDGGEGGSARVLLPVEWGIVMIVRPSAARVCDRSGLRMAGALRGEGPL